MDRALGVLLIAATLSLPTWAQQAPPVGTDLTEQVEVRLVLVDTVVVDRAKRTVADLTRDDFELFVDYDPRPIDTLDHNCPSGASEDPRSVPRLGDIRPAIAPDAERKLVLAVDYMHLGQIDRVDLIVRLRDMIAGSDPAAEEIMLVAITGDLRVEQIFTRDRQQILDTLDRMENDISLWLPQFDHLHELRFFRSLDQLVDLVGLTPGSKAVVLFSNLPGRSASYDVPFERIASKATHSRVAFYPVLARGLSMVSSPRLARLAVETGGRFTENTNDFSLGYARAQRDLTCRYVLGFYDENPRRGKARRVSVRVRRPGVRAIHSNNYEFPKPDEERDSRLQSALIAPEMFEDPAVRTRFFPLSPTRGGRWDGLLALEFPVTREAWHRGNPNRDVAATLRAGNHVAEEFRRRVEIRAGETLGDRSRVTYLERATARPGDYTLAAVVSDPDAPSPSAARASFSLPPIPETGLFVVPPILGTKPGGGVEFHDVREGTGLPEPTFIPLLGSRVEHGQPAVALTHVCRRRDDDSTKDATVKTTLRRTDETPFSVVHRSSMVWPDRGHIACKAIEDDLQTKHLAPGEYVFEFTLRHGDLQVEEQLAYTVSPPRTAALGWGR